MDAAAGGEADVHYGVGGVQAVLRGVVYDGLECGEVAAGAGAAEQQGDAAPAVVVGGDALRVGECPGAGFGLVEGDAVVVVADADG